MFFRKSRNFKRKIFWIGITTIATGGVAWVAAPFVATALGAVGLLGAASTGTTIATLHGCALTSASLYAVGGGSMAAGTAVITGSGATLGAGISAAAISSDKD